MSYSLCLCIPYITVFETLLLVWLCLLKLMLPQGFFANGLELPLWTQWSGKKRCILHLKAMAVKYGIPVYLKVANVFLPPGSGGYTSSLCSRDHDDWQVWDTSIIFLKYRAVLIPSCGFPMLSQLPFFPSVDFWQLCLHIHQPSPASSMTVTKTTVRKPEGGGGSLPPTSAESPKPEGLCSGLSLSLSLSGLLWFYCWDEDVFFLRVFPLLCGVEGKGDFRGLEGVAGIPKDGA